MCVLALEPFRASAHVFYMHPGSALYIVLSRPSTYAHACALTVVLTGRELSNFSLLSPGALTHDCTEPASPKHTNFLHCPAHGILPMRPNRSHQFVAACMLSDPHAMSSQVHMSADRIGCLTGGTRMDMHSRFGKCADVQVNNNAPTTAPSRVIFQNVTAYNGVSVVRLDVRDVKHVPASVHGRHGALQNVCWLLCPHG